MSADAPDFDECAEMIEALKFSWDTWGLALDVDVSQFGSQIDAHMPMTGWEADEQRRRRILL